MKLFSRVKRMQALCMALALACTLLGGLSCSKGEAPLASGGAFGYLPETCTNIVVLPGHEQSMRYLFSLAVYLFGQEAVQELRNTLFKNLHNETGLDLLSPASLEKNGFASRAPFVFAGNAKGGYYLSLPLINASRGELFMTQYAGSFTNAGNKRVAAKGTTQAILTEDRLYVFLDTVPAPETEGELPPELQQLMQNIRSASLIASAYADNSMLSSFFPAVSKGRSHIRIESVREGVQIEVKSPSELFDFFGMFRGVAPFPLSSGGSLSGTDLITFFSPDDLLTLSFTLDINTLWQRHLRALLYAQLERATKGMDNPIALLLSGGKPIAEVVMGMLDIENAIIRGLTGRAGAILLSLKGFSPLAFSRMSSLNALDGVIVLETRSTESARGIIQHLGGLSALPTAGQLDIKIQNEGGVEFVSFAVHQRYHMPVIYLARVGKFLCVGVNKESLLTISRQGESRGNLVYLFGEQTADTLLHTSQDITVRASVSALYSSVTSTLDERTRQNLGSFAEQFRKIQALSLARVRSEGGGSSMLLNLRFSSELPLLNPFVESSGEGDPLLVFLGILLAAIFLTPVVLLIVRKIRYR